MQTSVMVIQQADVVWQGIRLFRDGEEDFPDCLIGRVTHVALPPRLTALLERFCMDASQVGVNRTISKC